MPPLNSKRLIIHLLIFVYFWLIATAIRYPTSMELSLVPLDPNFPLHALAAQDLSSGGTPFINTRLDWPLGAPIRYLAWPLLIIGTVFNLLMEPIPAMNLSIVTWLTIQGFGMAVLFYSLFKDWLRAILAGTLALAAPQVLIASGNAQFENIAPFFFLLIGWSAYKKKPRWLIVGLLCTGFSSPYMGFLGLLLALCVGYKSIWTWITMSGTALLVWAYYNAVNQGHIHESTLPAPSHLGEAADITGLLLPINIAENGRERLPDPMERILTALEPTNSSAIFDDTWFWVMATASSYLGVLWCALGLIGLWNKRKDPLVRKLFVWMIVALVFSFGDSITIMDTTIPWIWTITNHIPGLQDMNTTHRFLMAPSLLLTLGVVCIGNPRILLFGTLLCIGETFLLTPTHWPIPARSVELPPELEDINDPFIFWPPPPVISSFKVTMTGLILDQPIATFTEIGASIPDANGTIEPLGLEKNRQGQTIKEWTNLMIQNDVNRLIQYRSFHEREQNLPVKTHQRKCYQSYCISLLVHEDLD